MLFTFSGSESKMGKISIFVFLVLFSLGSAQIKENFMRMKNQCKSFGCNSIENVKVVSKVECAMLFAQRSDVNLADFNVLLSTCELKFCNQINNDTFGKDDSYVAIFAITNDIGADENQTRT